MLRDFLFSMDDRVKIWMAVSAGGAAIYCVDLPIQAAILGICFMLCFFCGAARFVGGFIIGVCILAAVFALFDCLSPYEKKAPGWGMFFILLKFGPMFVMMVFIQASLNTSRFLRSLESMGLPSRWVIPLGVCLRFMPSVVTEGRQIRYAMRIRGIGPEPTYLIRRPLETIGYVLVPLLVRSLSIAEELARAAVARGIERPGTKTSLYDLGLSLTDVMFLIAWTMAIAGLLIADHLTYAGMAGVP